MRFVINHDLSEKLIDLSESPPNLSLNSFDLSESPKATDFLEKPTNISAKLTDILDYRPDLQLLITMKFWIIDPISNSY